MHEAYEIRAGLEEIAGRTAAEVLKENTTGLQKELAAMRTAVSTGDPDDYAEHDVKFHKSILQASGNKVLLQVWEALAFDIRIRISIGKVAKELHEVVESHQPIIDALQNGRGREASLLLRNHVETFAEYLKKSDSDSGVHRSFRSDLEHAKDVQQALSRLRVFRFLACPARRFISLLAESGATIMTFSLYLVGVGALRSVMYPERESVPRC